MIKNFIKNSDVARGQGEQGPRIADMRWVLNDTFLMILTTENDMLFFDALLQVYQVHLSHDETVKHDLYASAVINSSQPAASQVQR